MAKNNKNIPILCDRLLKRTRYELGGGGGSLSKKKKIHGRQNAGRSIGA